MYKFWEATSSFQRPLVEITTTSAYAKATILSPKKGEENMKLTTNGKKMKKIIPKWTPTKTTTKSKGKKKKTQIDKDRKRELKTVGQKKCKHVQKMFEKYGHGCMTTYGWHRFEEKYVVLKRDSDWLKYLLQKRPI